VRRPAAQLRDDPIAELVLDPIACAGHGLCAELLPEAIALDDWGYPVVDPSIPPDLREHALRAVKACPALALRLRAARRREPQRRRRPQDSPSSPMSSA
jgi:ferredoxin